MFNSKYSNVLTVILIIVIIVILGLIGLMGYDIYRKYYIDKEAQDYISQYEEQLKNMVTQNTIVQEPEEDTTDNTVIENSIPTVIAPVEQNNAITNGNSSSGNSNSSSSSKKPTYKGYNVLGTIEIPKTGINYPILEKVTIKSLQVSVAYYYGPGLNEVGNTTISGHNYRNGTFFGKNKQLEIGDVIYITDNSGKKVKYTIYNKYTTTENDAEYITRDTKGKREISLTTCTDDSKARLIIWAKE